MTHFREYLVILTHTGWGNVWAVRWWGCHLRKVPLPWSLLLCESQNQQSLQVTSKWALCTEAIPSILKNLGYLNYILQQKWVWEGFGFVCFASFCSFCVSTGDKQTNKRWIGPCLMPRSAVASRYDVSKISQLIRPKKGYIGLYFSEKISF